THVYDQILPGPLVNFGGKIYFGAHQYPLGHELYAYDPATGLLELIADINTGGGSSNPGNFHLIGDRLYFMANDEPHGRELWSLGNCFSLNMDIVPAAAGQANGQIELLTNGGALPYTFNWSNGATTSSQTGLAAGFYEVTVQDASGCEARRFVVLGETVGVQDHAPELGFKAFPNPVSGHALLHVSLDNPYTGLLHFELWNQDGRLMRKMDAEKTDTSFQTALYVDHLPAGIYFLRVQDRQRMAVKKIIVTD
ncbi:MAG: T9SS type A sorting domain-containing protein, partial [Saprospiraceae bacterium]|nr:T9SS type A sorting domain-containing protein [Saprospiraceae bacterium]